MKYEVLDTQSKEQVWSGIIETSREELASYESGKKQKNSDKVVDAVVSVINKTDMYPHPSPPLFFDLARLNFDGFVLNLPLDK